MRSPDPIPITYEGREFPSRKALAAYLSPLLGRSVSTLASLLSRYNGDVVRVLNKHPRRRPVEFEGQTFPNRKTLAEFLAPRLDRPARSVEGLLILHGDDIEAVLRARPYRPHRRPTFGRRLPQHGWRG